ncbi:MAG TPA: HD domain-containing protein [Flavipsychrobacter sp.]|nr:HD domain-containing protein [Flavipsychrobacter sp.]
MDEVLEKVRDFADQSHGDQRRKYTPERYIVHPIRVMKMCADYTKELPVLAAALLHDVLEDTPVGEEDIRDFLRTIMTAEQASQTTELVVELTDIYTKSAYRHWNRRKRKAKEAARIQQASGKAQTVKYADIIDNCKEIVEHDPDFAGVFLLECRGLLDMMQNGHPGLRAEAFEIVEQCLQKVPPQFRRSDR